MNNNDSKKAYSEAKKLLKTLKTKESYVRLHILLSHYYNQKTFLDSMSFHANKALEGTDNIKNDSIKRILACNSYNLLGLANNKRGLFETSKKNMP